LGFTSPIRGTPAARDRDCRSAGSPPLDTTCQYKSRLHHRAACNMATAAPRPGNDRRGALRLSSDRNLRAAVAARQYREDLFFRLSVFPIAIPPLPGGPSRSAPVRATRAPWIVFAPTFESQVKKKFVPSKDALVDGPPGLASIRMPGSAGAPSRTTPSLERTRLAFRPLMCAVTMKFSPSVATALLVPSGPS
jgi:hypothetical protein